MFNSFVLAVTAVFLAQAQTSGSDQFFEARQLLKHGEYGKAAAQLDNIDRSAVSPLARFDLGWLYGQAHQFDTALAIFRSLPSGMPDPSTHAYAIALCEFQLSNYAAAVAALRPFAESNDASPKLLNLLGVAYLKNRAADLAFATFQSTIKRYPSDPAAYFNSVTLLCENGRLKEGMEAAADTTRTFPELPEAHIVYGAAELENGRLAEGRQEFRAARRLAPASPEAAFFEALCEYRSGDYRKAVDVLRRALREGASDADVHTLLAESLLRQSSDDAGLALAELNEALSLNPNSVAALTARGKLYFSSKQYALSIADLEGVLAQDAKSRAALYTLARAYQASGNSARAQQLRSRLTEGSDDPIASLGQGRLEAAIHGAEKK